MSAIIEKEILCTSHAIHTLQTIPGPAISIILLHGMKFQAQTWQQTDTLEFLRARGYRVIAVDLPGFGRSPAADITPADVLECLIREEKLYRPVLLGPSMGGRIALEFTLDHPDLVGGLILVGAVGVAENRDRLVTVSAPTLAIWGSADCISPTINGHLLAQEIPGAQLQIIDGAPHPCYLEHTDQFHRVLSTFLTKEFPV